MRIDLGEFGALTVADSAFVPCRRIPVPPNIAEPAAALLRALEAPQHFPPLRRALTPDDRVAVVVDDRLPQLRQLVPALLGYLTEAGVAPEAITLVSPAGSRQSWVGDLPDALQDVRTEIHDPTNRQHLSYLASTRSGRRVYLNRTVVDADQTVVLAGCRYDALTGRSGGASQLFPQLGDAEVIHAADLALRSPDEPVWPLREEAEEVAWLLGVPFMVQVVEGAGDGLAFLVGGTVESSPEARRLLDARWRVEFERPAQLAVATVNGDASRQDFGAIARAAYAAARVVEPGGRVVVLSRADPPLGEGAVMLRDVDNPAVAARLIREHQPADAVAALQWLDAARRANLYLLSDLPDETVEEMFATPLQQSRQAQRLLDAAGAVLVLEDADKALAVLTA